MALALGGAVAAGAGCAGGTAGYSVSASYASPDLAYVSPGVYVVQDYDEPVFYTNNAYWRYDDSGRWYVSSRYNGGWRYSAPPRALYTIRQPRSYVHYRGNVRYEARPNGGIRVRDHRRNGPWHRDHRR
jgi:hypothetical protein